MCCVVVALMGATSAHAKPTIYKFASNGVIVPTNAADGSVILLSVDKSSLKADLRTWPDEPGEARTLESFKIAIGKAEGDKEREGDNKTPEGIYFAQEQIGALPAKYGPRAIPLNFPNHLDRTSGKTGRGIWLHGVDDDGRIQAAKVTEGCVAFYNSDIQRISQFLKPHQGIIAIARDASEINRKGDIEKVRDLSVQWAKAWADRDLDGYIGFYHDKFSSAGRSKTAYRNYKKSVFGSYKTMTVKLDTFRVITHPKYALTIMNQDFRGDRRFVSAGRKLLYWQPDASGQWKIVYEHFEHRRLELVKVPALETADSKRQASQLKSTRRPRHRAL
jgi:murein L,D-transpeptidase YafK